MALPGHPLFRVAFSISALGVGAYDGEPAIVRYGGERARMRWNENGQVWIGEPRTAISYRDTAKMSGPTSIAGTWQYFAQPQVGAERSWGWIPYGIVSANLAYNAGLKLQEKVDTTMFAWTPGSVFDITTVWYNLNDGDSISPLITPTESGPTRDVGVIVPSLDGLRQMRSTGWQVSPIGTPTNSTLLPHIYARYVSGTNGGLRLDVHRVQWRWMGDPTP